MQRFIILPLFIFLIAGFHNVSAQKIRQPFPSSATPAPPSFNPCGVDVLINDARKSAAFKAQEEKMNAAILHHRRTNDSTLLTLPVVFHIVDDNPDLFSHAQVIAAINDLNDAFSKSGAYSASAGVDTRIRFCLAKKDPDGGITNGITRTVSFFSNDLNPLIEDAKLKNLVQWDPSQYINIWYIKSMHLEIFARFECGNWLRMYAGGYATMPPGGGPADGIVVTGLGTMLAHEMGHYLGLYHTFEGLDCRNFNCLTDGDRVCDTPPDKSVANAASCSSPGNSCDTDTLSGFTIDMPDNIANFMDYGNSACHNEFTQGQTDRMRAAIATQRPGLLIDKCSPPCAETILACFTRDNFYPLPGATINFTNTSSGASNYEWLLDGVVVSTGTNYSTSFASTGKYKVTLKAFNTASCYSTFTHTIIVTCGVTARFYTDKRQIASNAPRYLDSIKFTNTSVNATSYQWLMANDKGMAEQVISTSPNFTYLFTVPANYTVRLIATNGTCPDTTAMFTIPVTDPTPDGRLILSSVECYQQTKLRVSYYVCNSGYDGIPRNIPISFYDGDPRTATARKLTTVYLADSIRGLCCGFLYTTIVDVGYRGLNSLYGSFNDSGKVVPVVFPNTNFIEKNYTNNIAFFTNFAFKVTATPALSILEWGDTLQLQALARPGVVTSYVWSTAKDLTCTNCRTPLLIADTNTTKQVVATSRWGCTDTTRVTIQVPPYNDFTVSFNDVQCAGADSLYINFTIKNSFKRPLLPATLSVSFYSGDPRTGSAVHLPAVFSIPDTIFATQATYSIFIKGMNAGNLYAVINDSAKQLPVSFPATLLLEKDYLNNITSYNYQPEVLLVQPADTTVFRKQTVPLQLNATIYNASSTLWNRDGVNPLTCSTCVNPVITVYQNSTIQVQTENRYGCLLKGTASIKIFPPDMQVKILDTRCYTNNTSQVTFSICMNNGYDSVLKNIPVSFYDDNSSTGGARLLKPVFWTPEVTGDSCSTYTVQIAAPGTNKFVAVVNDKGDDLSIVPNKQFDETDYRNNADATVYTPFTVSVNPSDTTISMWGSVQLFPQASGGQLTSYLWETTQYLSCNFCASPIAAPAHTMQYVLTAKNEFYCTDTAMAIVRTHSQDGVYIPTAFTPDGDGKNDIFYIVSGAEVATIKNFAIYNRWGQMVFNVKNVPANAPMFGWDGKLAGKETASQVYVYYVTVAMKDGKEKPYKGTFTLIR